MVFTTILTDNAEDVVFKTILTDNAEDVVFKTILKDVLVDDSGEIGHFDEIKPNKIVKKFKFLTGEIGRSGKIGRSGGIVKKFK